MKKHKISEMMLRIRTVYCTEIRKICFCDSYINTYPPSFQATFYNYLYNFLYVFIKNNSRMPRHSSEHLRNPAGGYIRWWIDSHH